jgi:dienelactone hydrolase
MVEAGASRCALLGFSMGGAVSVASADHPSVSDVVGLAPWLPEQLDGSTLAGRRFSVVHGQLDSSLPLVPGVSVARTRAAIDRFAARGVETSYTLVRGGVHGLALRAPWGGLIRLPRASAWLAPLASAIERFRVEN